MENTRYNYYVSKVRIRSEHCIGFLKGRWPSLQGLRICINNEKSIQYATLWITTCIHLHMFAMDHEDGTFVSRDRFLKQGLKIIRQEKAMQEEWEAEQAAHGEILEIEREVSQDIGLLEGKLKREELKEELFTYLNSLE